MFRSLHPHLTDGVCRNWHNRFRITYKREYLRAGNDHIEIESIKPARVPAPIISTGYRSYFLPAAELADAGRPVAFVTTWIEQEAAARTCEHAIPAKRSAPRTSFVSLPTHKIWHGKE